MLRKIALVALALAACAAGAADITSLANKAASAAKSGDSLGSIEALEQALDQLRNEAPLTLTPFAVVQAPARYYGDFQTRKNADYGKNEKIYFYVEPKNLVFKRNSSGLFEPAFEVDLEIKGSDGKTMKQPKFASFKLPTRSRVQDIYLNLTLSLNAVPAGKYDVRFIVRDMNSKKTASVDQAIVVK